MITYENYVGRWKDSKDLTPQIVGNIERKLLPAINSFLSFLKERNIHLEINPSTGTLVSGATYGGFRPQDCPIGAPRSNHKMGLAVDIYDPSEEIDTFCLKNLSVLEEFGLYLEHPSATKGWCHLQVKAPRSGNRVFYP